MLSCPMPPVCLRLLLADVPFFLCCLVAFVLLQYPHVIFSIFRRRASFSWCSITSLRSSRQHPVLLFSRGLVCLFFFCFYGNFWCFVLTCLWTCGGSPRNIRRAIAQLEEEGTNAYPHKFHASISIPDFVAKFQDVEVGEKQASGRRNRKAAPDPCRLAT